MKKLLFTLLLAIATAASAQTSTPGQGQPTGQQQQKTIKDPTEYNAYMSAMQQDPRQKAAALEGFVNQFPNSVVKEDALEQLMVAYQQANDPAKMGDAANRLLQVNPNNLRALALLTYTKRTQAEAATSLPQQQQLLNEASQTAQKGLQAQQAMTSPPEGVSPADFEKLKAGTTAIFNGAIGAAALANKDYATAQKSLRAAVEANPSNVQDIYPLALAYLQAKPQDAINGLWFIARAVNLTAANPAAQQQVAKAGQYYYKKHHGSDEGWQQLIAQTASTPFPPAGFTIAAAPPPPTPSEFANTIMQKYNGSPADMAYDDWLFILGSGNQQAAEKVWEFLKGKVLPLKGAKVISATPEEVQLATTDDDKQENKADVTVHLKAPLARVPQTGATANFWGVASSYTPGDKPPAVKITLDEGTDRDPNAKAAPPRRAPAKKRGTARRRPS